jgi:amino acid transporter
MVSGGTFGTEDIVHGAGYGRGILILLITPLLWALPVAFMIGELSSALPKEGGFYAWVRRAMGDFWGFQEAWLSLVASIFDMAIYPTLFVTYLNRLFPWFAEGPHHLAVGDRDLLVAAGVVLFCALLNVAGVRVVATTSVWLFFLLSAPFVLIVMLAPLKFGALTHVTSHSSGVSADILAGLLVCMWNYMGWDNASTIAAEVERPARTYPRAMLFAVLIVAVSYVLPIAAMWMTGLPAAQFETGSWADVAGLLGGQLLRGALVLAAMASAFGMFNSLVMSYSRLPLAMAQDGMLPGIFSKLHSKTRAPWVAITVLALAWTMCLGIGFERLITMDIFLYGASLLLEFGALVALRFREPELERPFRVPGGLFGALFIGVPPMVLVLVFAVARGQSEHILGMSSFAFGMILIAAGFVAYAVNLLLKPAGWSVAVDESAQPAA